MIEKKHSDKEKEKLKSDLQLLKDINSNLRKENIYLRNENKNLKLKMTSMFYKKIFDKKYISS